MTTTALIRNTELVFLESGNVSTRYHQKGVSLGGTDIEGSGADVMSFTNSQIQFHTSSVRMGNENFKTDPLIDTDGSFVMQTITTGFVSPTDIVSDTSYFSLVPYVTENGNLGATSTGTGAKFNATVLNGVVTDITIAEKGSGYKHGNVLKIDKADISSATDDLVITAVSHSNMTIGGKLEMNDVDILGDVRIGEKQSSTGHDIVIFAEDTVMDASFGEMQGVHKKGDIYANGNVYADSFDNTSDIRYKTNIQRVTDDESKKIYDLRPVSYNWLDPKKDQALKFGFIAQEMAEVYPNIVKKLTEKHLTLDYIQLIAPVINEVQNLRKLQNELHQKINSIPNIETFTRSQNTSLPQPSKRMGMAAMKRQLEIEKEKQEQEELIEQRKQELSELNEKLLRTRLQAETVQPSNSSRRLGQPKHEIAEKPRRHGIRR